MNILAAISQNYSIPFITLLKSIFQHNDCHINVYLMYSEMEEVTLKRLDEFVGQHGSTFVPIKVSPEAFGDSPVTLYFTKEMYYRLLAPALLPESEDRVLYLDVDIMVRGSIEEFYNLPFDGNMLIGMPNVNDKLPISDMNLSSEMQWERLHEDGGDSAYINSGVLLMNLSLMRENKFDISDIFKIIEEKREYMLYPDQDAINIYFRGSVKTWKKVYNYPPGCESVVDIARCMFSPKRRHRDNPIIVHYFGPTKPWSVHYRGRFVYEYHEFYREFAPLGHRIAFCFRPLVTLCGYVHSTVVLYILRGHKEVKTPRIKKLLK